MFCGYCGGNNPDTSLTCIQCGSVLQVAQPSRAPHASYPGQPINAHGMPPTQQYTAYTCIVCGYILAPMDATCPRCRTPRGMGVNPAASTPGSVTTVTGYNLENNSGTGEPMPSYLRGGWNWGAFYFRWVWGMYHKSYITFISLGLEILSFLILILMGVNLANTGSALLKSPNNITAVTGGFSIFSNLIGLAQLGLMIWFGAMGNEWAWRNRRFDSVENFRHVERTWAWWALGLSLASFLLCAIGVVLIIAAAASFAIPQMKQEMQFLMSK